jgi:hypothetical protein
LAAASLEKHTHTSRMAVRGSIVWLLALLASSAVIVARPVQASSSAGEPGRACKLATIDGGQQQLSFVCCTSRSAQGGIGHGGDSLMESIDTLCVWCGKLVSLRYRDRDELVAAILMLHPGSLAALLSCR